jgi:predicted DNA binding CopG/RHH family protein
MTVNKIKKLPKFKTEEAERRFWATHDASEYLDLSRAKPIKLTRLEPSTKTISLRLPESLLASVKVLAHKRDVPYQSLLKLLLARAVEQELR